MSGNPKPPPLPSGLFTAAMKASGPSLSSSSSSSSASTPVIAPTGGSSASTPVIAPTGGSSAPSAGGSSASTPTPPVVVPGGGVPPAGGGNCGGPNFPTEDQLRILIRDSLYTERTANEEPHAFWAAAPAQFPPFVEADFCAYLEGRMNRSQYRRYWEHIHALLSRTYTSLQSSDSKTIGEQELLRSIRAMLDAFGTQSIGSPVSTVPPQGVPPGGACPCPELAAQIATINTNLTALLAAAPQAGNPAQVQNLQQLITDLQTQLATARTQQSGTATGPTPSGTSGVVNPSGTDPARLAELQAQLDAKNIELTQLRADLTQATLDLTTTQEQFNEANTRVRTLEEQARNLQAAIITSENEVRSLREELNTARSQAAEAQATAAQAAADAEAQTAAEGAAAAAAARQAELEAQLEGAEAALVKSQADLQTAQDQKAEASAQVTALTADLEAARKRATEAENKVNVAVTSLENITKIWNTQKERMIVSGSATNAEVAALKAKLAEKEKELVALRGKVPSLDQTVALGKLRTDLDTANAKVAEKEAATAAKEAELERLRNELKSAQDQIQALQTAGSEAQATLETAEKALQGTSTQDAEITELRAQLEAAQTSVDQARNQLRLQETVIANLQKQVDETKGALLKIQEELEYTRKDAFALKKQLAEAGATGSSSQVAVAELQAALKKCEQEKATSLQNAEQTMAELQAQNRDLERNLDGMTKRNAECNHHLESLTESNQSILDMKDLEIETLRESKDNLETRIAAIEARTQKALNNARTNKNTSLAEATTQLQAQFEAAQTQFTSEKQALENRLTNLTDQLAIATTKASEKEADLQTLRDEKARITGLLGNSDDLVTAIRSLQQELDELRNQKATDDNKLFELTEAVNQKERTLAEQTSRLTSLESERNSLRQRLTEEQEGFNMRISKTKEAANSKEADAIAELEERLRIAEDFRDGLQTDLDATRDQLAALQGELVAAQSLTASKQAELDAFATLLPPAGNATQDLLARLRTLQQDLEAAKAARRESDTQFAEHASQVAELDRLIYKDAAKSATPRTLAELISRTRTFLQNCDKTNLEKAEIVKRLKVLQSKSDASEAELAGLRASLAAAQQNAASLTSQLDAIRASTAKNVETARSTATSAQQQVIDDLALQLNAANEAIDELRSRCDDNLAEQEATITQLTAEGERHKESTNKLITELHDITKRVKELQENHRKELEDIHTFYGGAVTGLSNYSEGMRQQGVRNATNAFLLNPGGGPSIPSPYTASDFAGIRPASSSSSASAPSSESWVVKPHQAQAYPAGSRPIDGPYSLSRVTQTGPKNASGVAGPTGVVNPTLTAESKALARPPFVTGKPHLNLPEPSTASSKQQTTINSPGRASMVPKKTGSRRKQKVSRKTRKNRK